MRQWGKFSKSPGHRLLSRIVWLNWLFGFLANLKKRGKNSLGLNKPFHYVGGFGFFFNFKNKIEGHFQMKRCFESKKIRTFCFENVKMIHFRFGGNFLERFSPIKTMWWIWNIFCETFWWRWICIFCQKNKTNKKTFMGKFSTRLLQSCLAAFEKYCLTRPNSAPIEVNGKTLTDFSGNKSR